MEGLRLVLRGRWAEPPDVKNGDGDDIGELRIKFA